MYKSNPDLIEAVLVKRINRFVAEIILNGRKQNVYVPNTGRLSELALPGTRIILSRSNSKFRYKILYIIRDSFPVMIDSGYSNTLFHELLLQGKVPDFLHPPLIRREPIWGNHRFDFLLSGNNNSCYIELKSCTLFHKHTSAFPDAVSKRASEHIKALAETDNGRLVFLILHSGMKIFVPNYHTDFQFYETLKNYSDRIGITALKINYDENLKIQALTPVPVVIPEVRPCGILLLILELVNKTVYSGKTFNSGYYVICIEEDNDIFRKVSLLKRRNGLKRILPDKLSSSMKTVSHIPVVSKTLSLSAIKEKFIKVTAKGSEPELIQFEYGNIKNLFFFYKNNPADQSWFWDNILDMRFGIYS